MVFCQSWSMSGRPIKACPPQGKGGPLKKIFSEGHPTGVNLKSRHSKGRTALPKQNITKLLLQKCKEMLRKGCCGVTKQQVILAVVETKQQANF
jgi:hypothetical protein